MSKFRNYISSLFLAAAIFGLLFSMAHYHSAGLECLDHANEQHYTDNELLCPVCAIAAYSHTDNTVTEAVLPEFKEALIQVNEPILSTKPFLLFLGRAPPFLI